MSRAEDIYKKITDTGAEEASTTDASSANRAEKIYSKISDSPSAPTTPVPSPIIRKEPAAPSLSLYDQTLGLVVNDAINKRAEEKANETLSTIDSDIAKAREKVNILRQQQDALYRNASPETVAQRDVVESTLGKAQDELTALLRQQEEAQKAQSYYRYADMPNNADYAEKSQFVQQPVDPYDALSNRASLYDFVNDKNGARQKIASEYGRGPSYLYGDWTPYAHLSEDEKGVFNYIYATEGEDAAKEYLDYLADALTARQGADIAERMKNAGGVSQALYGVTSGVNQFGSGIQRTIQRTFAENPQMDTTAVEYATSNILNDLDEEGKKGAAFAFKVAQIAGQMAPSILLSGAVGSILKSAGLGAKALGIARNALFSGSVGASSSGNAYKTGIEQYGMNHEQAQMYANLVGASEGGLTYLLGGIGQGGALVNKLLGGNGAAKFAAKVANIDNALARFVLQFGTQLVPRMGGEIIEENLQLVLEPAFRTILTGEDYDAPEINEIIETTLLSAVTSGLMSAPSAVGAAMQGGRPTNAPTQPTVPAGNAIDDLLAGIPAPTVPISESAQNAAEAPEILGGETVAENVETAQGETSDVKLSEDAAENKNAAANASSVTVYSGKSALDNPTGLAYTLASNIHQLQDLQPVKALTGTEMNDRTKKPSEQIRDFFAKLGSSVFRPGFGSVLFGEYGVGGILNHRPLNRAKMVSLTAVPEVIQNGKIISYTENWKGRGYDSYVFAAPVTINGVPVYVAAVVNKGPGNKFYLNECVDSEGNYVRIDESTPDHAKSGFTVQDGVTAKPGVPSGINLAQTTPGVKGENLAKNSAAPEEQSVGAATPEGMGAASAGFTVGHAPTYAQNQEHSTQPLLNDEARAAGADIGTHEVQTNKDTRYYAMERLGVDFEGEVADIRAKSEWDAIEMEMGQIILKEYAHEAAETGDYSKLVDWKRNVLDPHKTTAGQALQVLAQYAESSPESIVADAAETLATREKQDGTGDGNTVKTEKFKNLLDDIGKYAQRLDSIQDGDTASLIELIKELDAKRHTAGLFTKKTGKAMSAALEAAAERPGGFEKLKAIAAAQTRNVAEDMTHISPLEAFKSYRIMSMLSKIATYARNTIGNTVSYAGDVIANDAAVLLDMLMSKGTNTREIAFDRGPFSKEAWREAADSALFSFIEVGLDANASQATSKYEQSAGRTFKMTGNLLSRFLSTVSKYENLGLITADEFSKGLTRGEARRGLSQLARQGKANAAFIEDRASELAKQRTFTNDGKISSAMTGLRNIGNAARLTDRYGGSFGLGDIAIPFAKVPGNITSMAAQATPAGLAKSVMDVASVLVKAHNGTLEPGEQANAATAFGRGLVGTAGVFAAALLALKGILVYVDSDDKDELAIKKAQGLQRGLNINLSAAKRLVNGDGGEQLQEGDEFKSIDYLETLSAQLTMGAILADIFKEESGVSLRDIASANIEALGSAFIELPAVSQIQDIINGYTYSDAEDAAGKFGDAAVSFAGGQATSLIPNFFRGLVSSGDMNIRNPYATDSEGETVVNQIKQNIPGLRDDVPVSLDPLGNERTYSGTKLDRFVNANLAPGSNSVYSSNPIYDAMLDVGVYANKSAPNKVEFKGESLKLTADEKAQYQQTYGDIIESVVTEMVESSVWHGASKEVQGDMMRDVISLASQEAKGEFLASRGLGEPEDEEKLDKMDLSDIAEYIAVDKAFSAAEKADDFDAIEALLGDYNALSDEAKELMDNSHSRLDDISAANAAGVSVADWDKAYDEWKRLDDDTSIKTSDKPDEFSYWLSKQNLTSRQQNLLKEQLGYWGMNRYDSGKLDTLTDVIGNEDSAKRFDDKVDALKPRSGKTRVDDYDIYYLALKEFGSSRTQMDVIELYMPETTFAKMERAVDEGFTPSEFVTFMDKKRMYTKKSEILSWATSHGYTTAEAEWLYKLSEGTLK